MTNDMLDHLLKSVEISYYKSFKITRQCIYSPEGEVVYTLHNDEDKFVQVIRDAKIKIDEYLNKEEFV